MDNTQNQELKSSFEWYLNQGMSLMLLKGRGKSPVADTWEQSTSNDVTKILNHVEHGGNVAVIPGRHIVILDVDRKGGKDGIAEMAARKEETSFGCCSNAGGRIWSSK